MPSGMIQQLIQSILALMRLDHLWETTVSVSLAPVARTASQSPAPEIETYRPAGVFISYASEDHDIAKAFYQSLQALGESIYDRVKIFFDSKSIDGGDEIRTDIREGLNKSDFLVVLYTGLFKRSHGYTGYEVGFFDKLIEDEGRKVRQDHAQDHLPLLRRASRSR